MTSTTVPAGPPEHTPGAGVERLRQLWGADRTPESTPEVDAQVDALIEQAKAMHRQARAA